MSSMYFNLITLKGNSMDLYNMIQASKVGDIYTFQAEKPEPSLAEMDEIRLHRINEWGCSSDDLGLVSNMFDSFTDQYKDNKISHDENVGLVIDMVTQTGPCDKWCKLIAYKYNLDVTNEYYSLDDQVFELIKFKHEGNVIKEELESCSTLSHLRFKADGYIEIDDFIEEFIDSEYVEELGKMLYEDYDCDSCASAIIDDLEEELAWYIDEHDDSLDIETKVKDYLVKVMS